MKHPLDKPGGQFFQLSEYILFRFGNLKVLSTRPYFGFGKSLWVGMVLSRVHRKESRLSPLFQRSPKPLRSRNQLRICREYAKSPGFVDSDNEQADVLVTVHGIVDNLYVKELAKKTRRGLEKRVYGVSTRAVDAMATTLCRWMPQQQNN